MSDNKKRVRLDENNKLVVEDNNAVTTIEGTTSKISGVYEIADDDVVKLLLLINNNTIVRNIISYRIMGESTYQILTKLSPVIKHLTNHCQLYQKRIMNWIKITKSYWIDIQQ